MASMLGLLLLFSFTSAFGNQGWRTELRAQCLKIALEKAKTVKKSEKWEPDLNNPIVKEAGDRKSCDVTFIPISKDGEQGLGGGFVIRVDTVKKTSTVSYSQ